MRPKKTRKKRKKPKFLKKKLKLDVIEDNEIDPLVQTINT